MNELVLQYSHARRLVEDIEQRRQEAIASYQAAGFVVEDDPFDALALLKEEEEQGLAKIEENLRKHGLI